MEMAASLIQSDSGDSSKARFTNTKALFEQLERCGEFPSFYSPRLQRSITVPPKLSSSEGYRNGTTGNGLPPPAVPPKPATTSSTNSNGAVVFNKFQQSFASNSQQRAVPVISNGKTSPAQTINGGQLGSPLSQVTKNFTQLATELEKITNSARGKCPNGDEEGGNDVGGALHGNVSCNNTFPKTSSFLSGR